jgi:hypothetical protein
MVVVLLPSVKVDDKVLQAVAIITLPHMAICGLLYHDKLSGLVERGIIQPVRGLR